MPAINEATRSQGLATLTQVSGRRVYRPDEMIGLSGDTDDSPYIRLWSMLPREKNNSFKITVYRDEDFDSKVEVTAAAASGAATVVVNAYKQIVAGTLLYCPRTAETLRVTATPSSTSVAVTRGIGTSTAAALRAGDVLIIGQTAVTEGSGPVDTYSSEPWTENNYIETRRHGYKVTRHAEIEELWGQSKLAHEEFLHMRRFKRELETSLLMGEKAATTVSSSNIYLSGGIRPLAIESGSRAQFVNWDGEMLTRGSFDARVRDYFRQKNPGGSVLGLCGENMITILNGWVQDKLQINDQATDTFGTAVYRYKATNGEVINFLPHNLWTNQFGLQDQLWFVDLDRLSISYVDERLKDVVSVTRAKDLNSQELAPEGYDYFWREWWSEGGLKLHGTENIAIHEGIAA